MAFYKVPSNIKTSILGFVKHILDKFTVRDIDSLLSPCCKPVVTFDTATCSNGVLLFNNVTVSDVSFSNQTVTVILTSLERPEGAVKVITLDENGSWTGNLQSSFVYFVGDTGTFTVSLLGENSRVLHVSDPVVVSSLSNCN